MDRTKINDRSGATVGGSSGAGAAAAASPAGPGGVPNALAAALQKIKDKASKSGKFLSFICYLFIAESLYDGNYRCVLTFVSRNR